MGQLNFHLNFNAVVTQSFAANNGTMTFFPFSPQESISWNTLNFLWSFSSGTRTLSVGLYSLNGGNLSLANSISRSFGTGNLSRRGYLSMSDTSATQNITPGTWFLGLLISTSGASAFAFYGGVVSDASNAFPGAFIGGAMTDSTAALPTSYATSDLNKTGSAALSVPLIILSA